MAVKCALFILSYCILTACSSKASHSGDSSRTSSKAPSASSSSADTVNTVGGYDWGGGEHLLSSPELVHRTIEIVQSMAGEPSYEKNIYKDFYKNFARQLEVARGFDFQYLFPQILTATGWDWDYITKSPSLEAISHKTFILLENGDCPKASDETTADASISKHDLDGDVCFSIGNLTKIAPSDLTRQVMGLMLHEAVHLGGGDEAQAKIYQASFDVYFGGRFGEMLGEAYLEDVDTKLYDAFQELHVASNFISERRPTQNVYSRVGLAYGKLFGIPGATDPIALRLRLFLKNPQSAENFVKGLKLLMQDLEGNFDLQSVSNGRQILLTDDQLGSLADRIDREQEHIQRAWDEIKKEALCDDQGKFISTAQTWLMSTTCTIGKKLKLEPIDI